MGRPRGPSECTSLQTLHRDSPALEIMIMECVADGHQSSCSETHHAPARRTPLRPGAAVLHHSASLVCFQAAEQEGAESVVYAGALDRTPPRHMHITISRGSAMICIHIHRLASMMASGAGHTAAGTTARSPRATHPAPGPHADPCTGSLSHLRKHAMQNFDHHVRARIRGRKATSTAVPTLMQTPLSRVITGTRTASCGPLHLDYTGTQARTRASCTPPYAAWGCDCAGGLLSPPV